MKLCTRSLVFLFVVSCAAVAYSADKRITVVINEVKKADGSVGYEIEGPVPSRAYGKQNKKIRWHIVNNCRHAKVNSVKIHKFSRTDKEQDTEAFKGGPTKQVIEWTAPMNLSAGDEKNKKSNKARDLTPDELQNETNPEYHYTIEVAVEGANPGPIIKDGWVIIVQ